MMPFLLAQDKGGAVGNLKSCCGKRPCDLMFCSLCKRQPEAETLQHSLSDNVDSAGADDDIPACAGHGQSSRESPELLWGVALQSDVLQPLQRQPSSGIG